MAKREQFTLREFLDRNLAYIFIIPAIFCLCLLVVYPVLLTVWNSMTNFSLLAIKRKPDFIGFRNYIKVLSGDEFWVSLKNGVLWTFFSISFQLFIGFIAALGLQKISRGRVLFRLLLIVPWTFPAIAMAFLWRWMLDPVFGIFNYFLMWLGILQSPIPWFGLKETALWSTVAMNVWFGFPFMMLAMIAGLQTIPAEYYEVAKIEGASLWHELRYITLPLLKRIIGITIILRTIWNFNNFTFIFLTTGGGPGFYSQTIPIYAYRTAWKRQFMGRASAISVLLLIILVMLVAIYFMVFRIESSDE